MLKFIAGVIFGALLSIAYVRFNVELPGVLQLPERLRNNLVSTATEAELFDLGADPATQQRALEVFFAYRPMDATRIDAEAGHPFLIALHRRRSAREARLLLGQWDAYDEALSKPALRAALERKHGTSDDTALKQAMLFDALDRKPFLKAWLQQNGHQTDPASLREVLRGIVIASTQTGDEGRRALAGQ